MPWSARCSAAGWFTYIMESLPKGRREVMGNRWQFMFAVGSIAAILMVWLVQHGRFREAKKITADMYGDPLDMLPDHDVEVEKPKLSRFLAEIRPRPKAWAATKFAWISCWCQNTETAMFGFFIPLLLTMLSLSDMQTQGINLAVFVVAAIAAFIAPQITPKIGHRGISISGFAMAGAAIVVSAMPMAFDAFGEGPAILIGAAFSLIGLLSAIFILPEVYNYDETSEEPVTAGAPAVRPAD